MIVDTNALSAVADGERAAVAVFSRANRPAIPVIVIGEFRFGIARSRHGREYLRWLEQMIAASKVLDVSEETTVHYADIHGELKRAGTPIPSNDVWIAALCRQHASPIMSLDQHFDSVEGLQRLAW